ncbi:DUF488 domain-containing protein [Phormidium yuhuli AB48]|uniref:DUF488 domain-containing protein n=1 Tax=Phormidium yuhuli AB48 TaxID=2940671 RepID=A0ABY5AMV4_9CYAN|nr:DUF488 domain-containing protein [Phormidium yuhuli]USR90538.1 DUF488 domain-containing protein [Phormidium yuhuli AB48]
MELFSIGHSNSQIEVFLGLLQQHQITALADVRSSPYSRFLPHFNQESLKSSLAKVGIHYVFLGKELGAKPSNLACYVGNKARYDKIAATEEFQQGLERLVRGLQRHRIAVMCAEKDPLTCHRAILVCRQAQLLNPEITIHHILQSGELESQHQLEERLLIKQGFQAVTSQPIPVVQLSLFTTPEETLPSREECLAQAYERQGEEIAYVET